MRLRRPGIIDKMRSVVGIKPQSQAEIQRALRAFIRDMDIIARDVTNVRLRQEQEYADINFLLDVGEPRDIPSGVVVQVPDLVVTGGRLRFPTTRQFRYDRDVDEMFFEMVSNVEPPTQLGEEDPLPVYAQRGNAISERLLAGEERDDPRKIAAEAVSLDGGNIDPHVQFLVEGISSEAFIDYSASLVTAYRETFL